MKLVTKILGYILIVAGLAIAAYAPAWAQEHAAPKGAEKTAEKTAEAPEGKAAHEPGKGGEHEDDGQVTKDLIYKTINFLALFGLLGYFLGKPAKQFFADRTAAIQKGMADAKAARIAAEQRLAEIEQKLARLGDDVSALRATAAKEDAVQADRMRQETEAEAAKILAHAESEIDTLARSARLDLKTYAAKLAVDLAEQRIKAQMTPEAQSKLLQSYVKDLSTGGGKN